MAAKTSKKKEVLTNSEEVKIKAEKPAVKKKTTAKKTTAKKSAAVKKTPAKTAVKKEVKTEAKTNKNTNAYLLIDYPVEGDQISCGHYAIRVGASPDGYVELSFNNGEWHPCRYDDGFWWFDWVYFTPGNYTLAARMVDANGNVVIETAKRKCKVC